MLSTYLWTAMCLSGGMAEASGQVIPRPAIKSAESEFEFSVASQSGLTVTAKGIPVIRGSWFQYYAPGWTKGYYSSRWNAQVIDRINSDSVRVSFQGAEGQAFGGILYQRTGNKLKVSYEFNWKGDQPARVEVTPGMVSMIPFFRGTISDDRRNRDLSMSPATGDAKQRNLVSNASLTVLNGTSLRLRLQSTAGTDTFDARGYDQDWAEKEPILWQGVEDVPVERGKTTNLTFEYEILPQIRQTPPARTLNLQSKSVESGILPDSSRPVLIPKPKKAQLDWNQPMKITNLWRFPAGRPKYFDLFKQGLEKRFKLPLPGSIEGRIDFDGGMSKLEKLEGGYLIKIGPQSISVYGQEEAGLAMGMNRLIQLAFVKDGALWLPTGTIDDEPRTDFRGVHLFVGPKAPEFQSKLWENLLLPLGMNKVVLQCERTEWKTLPKVRDEMTMAQSDLVKLFQYYRSQNVEPIPLIQSLGHMEWFFARGANLDLAYNRNIPYAIDPRKQEAKDLVGKLWDEAISVLKPKTVHFGLDEIDMRGFEPKNPKLTTELWREMLPYLGSVATRNNVRMMLWGDKGLAPSEAVDAAHGDSVDEATDRRAAIPKGSLIADWHYRAEQNHVPFLRSLQVWRNDGHKPIASSWYRPENIRGFYLAAALEDAGTLQTTWAGYESNEDAMFRNLNQFTAMVLAADYAWSGRPERLEELPYRAEEVFAKMYSPIQSVLTAEPAQVVGPGRIVSIGDVKFASLEDVHLVGLSGRSFNAPSELSLIVNAKAKELALALSTEVPILEGTKVAEVEIQFADQTQQIQPIHYGVHVRAGSDLKPIIFGKRTTINSGSAQNESCLRIPLSAPQKVIRSVRIRSVDKNAGLQLHGVSWIGWSQSP